MLNGFVVMPVEEYNRLKSEHVSECIRLYTRAYDDGVEVVIDEKKIYKVALRLFDEQIPDKDKYTLNDSIYVYSPTLAVPKKDDVPEEAGSDA